MGIVGLLKLNEFDVFLIFVFMLYEVFMSLELLEIDFQIYGCVLRSWFEARRRTGKKMMKLLCAEGGPTLAPGLLKGVRLRPRAS